MNQPQLLLPRALLKALGPAVDGEDVGAIIVDLAAGGLIQGFASYVTDQRHVDYQPQHDVLITQHQWQRVVHQGAVADVWAAGTVRLDSDVKNHLYYVEIVGIRFEEQPIRQALERYGLSLVGSKRTGPKGSAAEVVSPPDHVFNASPRKASLKGGPLPDPREVKLIGIADAAKLLSVSTGTIYNWRNDGKFELVTIGRRSFVRGEDILRLADGG